MSCQSSLLVSYENLSSVTADKQDALCTILTGGGLSTRTLHTNAGETLLKVKRPVVVNGINPVITSPDLVDRFISIELLPITSINRKT